MEVIPAIDILDGKCVRLFQGDYDKETIFSDYPIDIAKRWESYGAQRLHLIDLDGAKNGKPINQSTIVEISQSVDIPIQVGGGIRDFRTVEKYIQDGIDRVIVGTAAVRDPDLISKTIEIFGEESVMVSIDAKDGVVAVDGWIKSSKISVFDLMDDIVDTGLKRFMYTDISRDGTLSEPNYGSIEDILEYSPMKMLAAGGISSIDDLNKLKIIGVEGAIVGRAIYTGDIVLSEVFDTIK
ncbi:MAG: 1-(5-phosphoribosyl)-5-[(5-phosphoribosylamino)methylideneamino]imidazole-4-carboxamide isomerase [Chloroflexi bacterium]|nr:1-(5-phosphoribosyl)-5-[(5-phosphoribosylamino)methylideneamino]imidazole-4-carboxamide isomerase [Chloroflexota bacterium]